MSDVEFFKFIKKIQIMACQLKSDHIFSEIIQYKSPFNQILIETA